ncbi:MAG: hypothetical protein KC457_30555, partial [Myxococcales bacterium]|nr:hypothetical protein [Myxococcales bacterium]
MHLLSVCRMLGIPVQIRRWTGADLCAPPAMLHEIDLAPTQHAQAYLRGPCDGVVVGWLRGRSRSPGWGPIVHEAIHLLIGPETCDDELGLMAVERAAWSKVSARWRREWRMEFAGYGLFGRPLGHDDSVFKSSEWSEEVEHAESRGWLRDGEAISRGESLARSTGAYGFSIAPAEETDIREIGPSAH